MSDESRFDRLEEKIDRLSEAVVSLARMEERVDELEDISAGRGHFIRFFERIFWIIFTAGIGALFWIFRA
jgi:hypothetical protein